MNGEGYIIPGFGKFNMGGKKVDYTRNDIEKLLKKGFSYGSIMKRYEIGEEELRKIKVKNYENEDIADLLMSGKKDEYILGRYDLNSEQLAAVKSHIEMGTYKKRRNRQLSLAEVEAIYFSIDQKAKTADIAKKFNTSRISIMGFKSNYTKKINSGMDLENILSEIHNNWEK